MKDIISSRQYIDTLTLVRILKRLDTKLRSGRACRQAAKLSDWIHNELERRAAQARRAVG